MSLSTINRVGQALLQILALYIWKLLLTLHIWLKNTWKLLKCLHRPLTAAKV